MQIINFLIKLTLPISCFFLTAIPAYANPGNQSDVTGPNTIEVIPNSVSPVSQNRSSYETQLPQANVRTAVQIIEEFQALEFSEYLGVELNGEVPCIEEISQSLYDLWQATGKKAAVIYVSSLSDQLELLMVLPKPLGSCPTQDEQETSLTREAKEAQLEEATRNKKLPEVSREIIINNARKFRSEITSPVRRSLRLTSYLQPSQQLYNWLVAPLEADLEANDIDTLVFSMDSGLRSLPIAALHDGEQFLVEKYASVIIPSFGLTDTGYFDFRQNPILAMGASQFTDLPPLPAVPDELENVVSNPWRGESFLNEGFTVDNFKARNQQQKFSVIHLATHGEFRSGDLKNSYIQFADQKLGMNQLREITDELGWSTAETAAVELLVLSACRTALGDESAELGFAGLAVQAGVKSALASLWFVSDEATLALMGEFYQQLIETPIKAEALRQTQLEMLRGEVRFEEGKLLFSNGKTVQLSQELAYLNNVEVSHPYFWSAFTMIGNWN